MKYQFRPYAKMQPTTVTLTGKVYEKGEHPLYTEHKIIEVIDEQDEIHYAFEDELKPDEVKEQLEVIADEFAIGFAEWLKESGYIIELIKGSRKTNNILEIYKKEKGL